MLHKFLLTFPSVIWCIFLGDISEALDYNFESESPNNAVFALASSVAGYSGQHAVSASASAQAGYSGQLPAQPNFLIDLFARSLSDGLLNSPVLSNYSTFREDQPHDLLFRVGSAFLGRAGISDTTLPEVAATAVKNVGYVDSQLFFDAIGYMVAKFLFAAGYLKDARSVTYYSLRVLGAIDLVACIEGVFDTETVMNSIAGGLFKTFESLQLATYDYLAKLFYLFAEEIDELSAKKLYDFSHLHLSNM